LATVGTTAEGNKAVVLRYVEEVWNAHDLNAIDDLVSPEYVKHAVTTDEYRYGGARRIWEWILYVFPDHRFDIEDAAADGETVAVRGTMTGTHEGELMSLSPTGRCVAAQQSHWFRVEDGKVAEHWAVRDDLGMLQQLGVMPFDPS
jgi:predicted ester cyclase